MPETRPRVIASDEKSKRFILSVGSDSVARDFTTRVTKLPPHTGDKPAEVLAFQKKSKKPEKPMQRPSSS
jgi:hypothetical protein